MVPVIFHLSCSVLAAEQRTKISLFPISIKIPSGCHQQFEFTPTIAPKHDLARYQRAPNPPEFAQPRLSRVKGRSSPARGYKFGCVCPYMASHYVGEMTPAIYEQTHPNLYPLAGDDRPLTLVKQGCANSGGFGAP